MEESTQKLRRQFILQESLIELSLIINSQFELDTILEVVQHTCIGNFMADFKIQSELGKGSYGTVYKVFSEKDKKIYVLKKINMKHMK